jgi:hypothetical protein
MNNWKTLETNYKFKSRKRELELLREKSSRSVLDKSKSSRQQRIISLNSRLRDWLKRREWKMISRERWLKSSLRMSV